MTQMREFAFLNLLCNTINQWSLVDHIPLAASREHSRTGSRSEHLYAETIIPPCHLKMNHRVASDQLYLPFLCPSVELSQRVHMSSSSSS